MKTSPSQSTKTKLYSSVRDEGIAVPIYAAGTEFLVRYRDGKQRRSRTFERLAQAQEFGRFLGRRQHWVMAAKELGARQFPPVVPKFILAPTTASAAAVDNFLSACGQMGTSGNTLRAMASVLRGALPDAPTVGALTLSWSRQATAPPDLSGPKRALRRAVVGRFLGWLARQPIEVPAESPAPTAGSPPEPTHLTVAQAEALLRACPDLDTQRLVALSLFAGLRPREVEALKWEDVQSAIAVYKSKKPGFRRVPIAANLMAWLKAPQPVRGPVVSKAARRKLDALLLKLKVPLHALRTTYALCWLALHGVEKTARQAEAAQVFEAGALPALVSRAEAEGFFGLTPD